MTIIFLAASCAKTGKLLHNWPNNNESETIYSSRVFKIIVDNTPYYKDANSSDIAGRLAFNRSVKITEKQGTRFRVALLDRTKLGWVEGNNLLYNYQPIRGEKGTEKKFIVKTIASKKKKRTNTVNAYLSPDLSGCKEGCRKLSPFTSYYIFEERKNSYLLGDSYKVTDETRLIGWVDKQKGFIWDTGFGVRPIEKLVFPEEHELAGQEKHICAYVKRDDAYEDKNCIPILGGDRWYRSSFRIPLLAREADFYRVMLPLSSVPGKRIEKTKVLLYPNDVIVGYIPVSDDVVLDLWLRNDELDNWLLLLNLISSRDYPAMRSSEKRRNLVEALKHSLEQMMGKPLYEDTGETIEKFVNRKGILPVRVNSPLFKYSLDELEDPEKVPNCEIDLLIIWVHTVKQMLAMVSRNLRPVYESEEYPVECPSGNEIPFVSKDVWGVLLGKDNSMRYNHIAGKRNIYWVPNEFLP